MQNYEDVNLKKKFVSIVFVYKNSTTKNLKLYVVEVLKIILIIPIMRENIQKIIIFNFGKVAKSIIFAE